MDLGRYAEALLKRFKNPTIRHRLWQIAMDGSQKLPQRLLGTIQDRLEAGASTEHLMLGVAGWARYVAGEDKTGQPIDVRDPHAASLRACMAGFRHDPATAIHRLLGREDIFGATLPRDARFAEALIAAFGALASMIDDTRSG
jgi:fructuronate reductase